MVSLNDLVVAAKKQQNLEDHVNNLAKLLKDRQEELRRQSQEIVPSMMDELEITNFELSNGYKISVQDKVQAKIPEKYYAEAFEWLRENDFDSIIKSKVVVDFGKGEDAEMERILQLLLEAGVVPQLKQDIHHMTLKSFVREQLEQGTTMPLEKFGAYVIRESVITAPK